MKDLKLVKIAAGVLVDREAIGTAYAVAGDFEGESFDEVSEKTYKEFCDEFYETIYQECLAQG